MSGATGLSQLPVGTEVAGDNTALDTPSMEEIA